MPVQPLVVSDLFRQRAVAVIGSEIGELVHERPAGEGRRDERDRAIGARGTDDAEAGRVEANEAGPASGGSQQFGVVADRGLSLRADAHDDRLVDGIVPCGRGKRHAETRAEERPDIHLAEAVVARVGFGPIEADGPLAPMTVYVLWCGLGTGTRGGR